MPLPRPFRRRSAPAQTSFDAAPVPAPVEGLATAAAEAAEADAAASAAAWVEEPGDGPPLDPPGWFRDEPLADSHGPAESGSDAAADAAPAGEVAADTPPAPEVGAPLAVLDAAEAETAPDAPADGELPEAETDAVTLPGTIYRTDPLPPEDTALARRRRSPMASVLLGLLILIVVGVGGFGIGLLLPLLIPLPAENASVVSPVPTVPSVSASPGASPGVGGSPAPSASAAPSASPSPSPAATPLIYVVKRGDQLGRIAASFGITLQAIEAANNIANPNLIIPGQKLVIPAPSASPLASGGASPSAGPRLRLAAAAVTSRRSAARP